MEKIPKNTMEHVSEEEKTMLENLKKEFSRPIPTENFELAKTADINLTHAPSHATSIADILQNKDANPDSENLTEMGRYIKQHLKNNTLIDLGAGRQDFVPNLAEASGAKRYIGVDIEIDEHAEKRGDFEKYTLQDDMLLMVSKLPDNYGSFFLAGIESYGNVVQTIYGPDIGDAEVDLLPDKYMEKLLEEIYRATKRGGLLITGINVILPDIETAGFKHIEFAGNEDLHRNTFVFIKE